MTEAQKKRLEADSLRLLEMTAYERPFWESGTVVCGMDEAGRGPLAGPVAAGAVLLPKEPLIHYINDSKKLSEKKREALFGEICALGLWNVALVEAPRIDEINILNATKEAFCAAFAGLGVQPAAALVDAVEDLAIPAVQIAIIKGDAKSYLIAAASIMAKVTRDRLMVQYDEQYPQYGFARHKGYGTAAHIEALIRYGPCPLHRRSFIQKWL